MTKLKRMAIIASYVPGEQYGLLGPQMAATVIENHTPAECIVIGVTRDDSPVSVEKTLADYFQNQRPVIGFSTLSGRPDLFLLARTLTEQGAFTILAGPQADVDYLGEKGWQQRPHRFHGLADHFTCALHGPSEEAITLLKNLDTDAWKNTPGLLYRTSDGSIARNPALAWNPVHLRTVRWNNLYILKNGLLTEHSLNLAQVLQQLGCPHASRETTISVDYPSDLGGRDKGIVSLNVKGCSFCDVAVDKGFTMVLDRESVIEQIRGLPEAEDKRKMPFELINESPLPSLPWLLQETHRQGIRLSQINLTMRADWFLAGERHLAEALAIAEQLEVRILASSMGFESFNDVILENLHKGLTVGTNLTAIRLMRSLKQTYPQTWGYSRQDGAVHGFIHPTPWDTAEIMSRNQQTIMLYRLPDDILPSHSVPLIIHHASWLGDWAREIEIREHIAFDRVVSTIGWWTMTRQE